MAPRAALRPAVLTTRRLRPEGTRALRPADGLDASASTGPVSCRCAVCVLQWLVGEPRCGVFNFFRRSKS